jgi:VanZ family protein
VVVIVTGRQKNTIVVLIIYWIALVVLAHMPIPQMVYQAKVSDKWLHFLAYLNLVFLLWFSIYPDSKVKWRNKALWLVFLIVVVYGGIDELTQPYFGRTKDLMDFLANVKGTAAGLVIFAFLTFWPALLAVWAISIFGVATLISADLSKVAPILGTIYHILAYAGFTLIWAQLINLYLSPQTIIRRLLLTISLPLGLMFFVKASSMLLGRYFTTAEILFSGGAIIAAGIVTCLFARIRGQKPFLVKGV